MDLELGMRISIIYIYIDICINSDYNIYIYKRLVMFNIYHTSTIKNTSRQTEQTTLRTGSQVTWHFHVKDSLSLSLARTQPLKPATC